jgi:ribosomal protein S18 acetylase RimI-like enzyme
MDQENLKAHGIRFSVKRNNSEAGHAYVYILHNDLHAEPFALLEDVHVEPEYQGQGIGNELVGSVIVYAKSAGCYKLLATSRNDGTRLYVHNWYKRLGFVTYGTEFRMTLI